MSYASARSDLVTLLSRTVRGTITAAELSSALLAIFDAYQAEQVIAADIEDVTGLQAALDALTAADGTKANAADSALTGTTDITQAVKLGGVISPTQLSANTDDWAPTGFATATVIRVSTDASRNLTGIAAGAARLIKVLANIGSNNLVLKHDATSTAANRFLLPGSTDFVLRPNMVVIVWYDSTSSRWRLFSQVNASTLLSNAAATLTAGYTATAYDLGTLTTGTTTPDPANGNLQRYINGGVHTLAAPTASGDYTITIQVTNNGSAGAVTLSGFTKTSGDSLTTTNGDDFLLHIIKINGFTRVYKEALQ